MAKHGLSEVVLLCWQEFVIFQVALLARVGDPIVCGDLNLELASSVTISTLPFVALNLQLANAQLYGQG